MARTPQDPTPPTVPDDIPQGDEDDDEDVDDEAQYPRSYAIGSNATLRAGKMWCRDSTGRFLPVMSQKRHIVTVVLV